MLGDTKKALDYLSKWNQKKVIWSRFVALIKDDPLFGGIRDEPEFQQIVSNIEDKYQAEYERVTQWLEEKVML